MVIGVKPEIQNYQRTEKLLDGRKVTIRLIMSDDKKMLTEFYSRVSNESRFSRFHYSKGELTDEDLTNFCDTDDHDSLGLVAEQAHGGQREILGVGRFYRLPAKTHTAEVAFVVQDSEQRKGIGTHLLKHLAKLAWELDIYFFLGEVLRENGRMLSILRKSDPEMHVAVDSDSSCAVTFSVAETIFRTP
jgi:GNAT superfamily N-acetyltransferase